MMEMGKDHLYLGMQIKIGEGKVTIDMSFYLDKILQESTDLKVETLPGKKNLLVLSTESPLLDEL